jgi:hypothetical protein
VKKPTPKETITTLLSQFGRPFAEEFGIKAEANTPSSHSNSGSVNYDEG